MIHIYYHIYAFGSAIDIVKQQMNLILKSFDIKPKVNIIITTPDRQGRNSKNDCSAQIYDWLNSEILCLNKNFIIREFSVSEEKQPNEWKTLNYILKDRDTFSNKDCILYFHTKGASHELVNKTNDISLLNERDRYRFVYEKNSPYWKQTMEYFLIEKNQECIDILRNSDYNTVGVFLNEPMWNCEVYAGNFFWIRGDYAKTLLTTPTIDEIDMENDRFSAEFKFINTGINWKPYSMFNIPYDKFTNPKFHQLIKEI